MKSDFAGCDRCHADRINLKLFQLWELILKGSCLSGEMNDKRISHLCDEVATFKSAKGNYRSEDPESKISLSSCKASTADQ